MHFFDVSPVILVARATAMSVVSQMTGTMRHYRKKEAQRPPPHVRLWRSLLLRRKRRQKRSCLSAHG